MRSRILRGKRYCTKTKKYTKKASLLEFIFKFFHCASLAILPIHQKNRVVKGDSSDEALDVPRPFNTNDALVEVSGAKVLKARQMFVRVGSERQDDGEWKRAAALEEIIGTEGRLLKKVDRNARSLERVQSDDLANPFHKPGSGD